MKKIYLAIAMILVVVTLSVYSCASSPAVTSTVTTTQFVTPTTPKPTPEYHTLTFTLNGPIDKIIDWYSFQIYLLNNETLHFSMLTDSTYPTVSVAFITPSQKFIVSSAKQFGTPGKYADGTLDDENGNGSPWSNLITSFKPSDYQWGEGYYQVYFNGTGRVTVEYWIQN